MKKTNWFVFLVAGTVPEIILAMYLQDIWHTDFWSSLFGIYAIFFTIIALRFIVSELIFRLFTKSQMIEQMYSQLASERWPNPWNYYIDDGISYFYEVAQNFNNEMVDTKIRLQAMEIYAMAKMLETTNNLGTFWRIKKCYAEAIKKYMEKHFPNSMDDANVNVENIFEVLKSNEFPNPENYSFKHPLEYFRAVITDDSSGDRYVNNRVKKIALEIDESFIQKTRSIQHNEIAYDLDESDERAVIEKQYNEYSKALKKYSKYLKKFEEE